MIDSKSIMKKDKINLTSIIIYILGFIGLLISFFYGADGTGTPVSGDFKATWPFVLQLKERFLFDPTPWTIHFPLNYYFLSRLSLIIDNVDHIRFFYCLISLAVPFLFFLCLKKKYRNENLSNLFILSAIILFTPSFIYSAIWANDNIISYIFILLAWYFLFEYKNMLKEKKENQIFVYISFFFLALACYSRQYYAILFVFHLLYFFNNLKFVEFLKVSIFCFLLSVPGIIYLYLFPNLLNLLTFSGNIYNTVLANVASLLIYTFPIIIINIFFSDLKLFNLKKILIYFLIAIVIFSIILINFEPEKYWLNGGVFFYFSKLIFNNYLLLYFAFIINIVFLLILFHKTKDIIIILALIFIFRGILVNQMYFEPLFFLLFFLFTQSKFKTIFLKNKTTSLLLVGYHVLYYLVAVTDVIYLIKL